jgi:hypothetical protein
MGVWGEMRVSTFSQPFINYYQVVLRFEEAI